MSYDDGAVRVAIRVRPFINIEKSQECTSIVTYPSEHQIQLAQQHTFTYDHLYSESTTQVTVYETCVAPLVESFFEGYNATILAYGQTGSGKTHTMGTNALIHNNASAAGAIPDDSGIIPRVIHKLFQLMKEKEKTHTFLLSASFLEIYNDELFDLLCTVPRGRADRPIPVIKESRTDRIEVTNMVNQDVKSFEEALETLERGSLNRATGSTNMNATSSRSHAIFTLQLSQKVREDELGVSNDEFITSKFHFVDLAGSERLKRTGAVGERMKEGININQGLLALGNVISILGDPTRKGGHVPFRDSKITRLLQDSLGGNSKTLMIANVSPADVNREETLNTLQYANRAKNIKNMAVINRDPISQKLDMLRGRIKELEAELNIYRSGSIPTAEQRAEITALSEAVAAGRSTALASFGSHGHHSSMMDVPQPIVGIDEMVVKAEEWAEVKARAYDMDGLVRSLTESNARLRQDLNLKNDERLKVVSLKDGLRRKIEHLADMFPEVKTYLVKERNEIDQEKAKAAAVAAAQKLKEEQAQPRPSSTTQPSESPVSPDAASISSSPILSLDQHSDSTFIPVAAEANSAVEPSSAVPRAVSAPTVTEVTPPAAPAAPSAFDLDEEDQTFFSLYASGGSEIPFNKDLTVIAEKNLLIHKLLRKFHSQKEKLAHDEQLLTSTKKQYQKLKKQNRSLQRAAHEHGSISGAGGAVEHSFDESQGGASLDHSREDEIDDDEDGTTGGDEIDGSGDNPLLRRRQSSELGGKDLQVGVGGGEIDIGSPVFSPSTDPMISPEDLEELNYDSAAEKEDEEMKSLSTLAKLKKEEHHQFHQTLLDEESNLNQEISAKEEFLQKLAEAKVRTQQQQQIYEQRVNELQHAQQEKEARINELEKLMASKPTTAQNVNGGLSQAESKELAKSRAELKKLSDELKNYREKLRATQDQQKRQHAADEAKIKQLTNEIERAKKARVDVSRKMDESSGKYKEWVANYENKMKLMAKTQRKAETDIRTLNEQLVQQAIQLKRAREANNVLKSKVRDQDSTGQVARNKATAAAVAARIKNRKANMPYLGNYNANATGIKELKSARGAGPNGAAASAAGGGHRRKVAGGSISKNDFPQAEKLSKDIASFVLSEASIFHSERAALAHKVQSFQSQLAHYTTECKKSEDAILSPDFERAGPEESKKLEEKHNENELGVHTSQTDLSKAQHDLTEFDQQVSANMSLILEDRVAQKFKTLMNEPTKKVITFLLKTMIEMQLASPTAALANFAVSSPNSQANDDADSAHLPTPFTQPLEPTPTPTASHFRRSSAIPSITTSTSNSNLSGPALTSPLVKSNSRSSLPAISSSPPRVSGFDKTRRSAAEFLSPKQQLIQQQQAAAAAAAAASNSQFSSISLSPLQPHLSQAMGIHPPSAENGESDLEYLRLPANEHPTSTPPADSGSLFSDDEPFTIASSSVSPSSRPTTSNSRILHNNFTVGSSEKDEEESKKPSKEYSKNKSQVFDRLTDPTNFTGTSKHLSTRPSAARTGVTSSNLPAGSSQSGLTAAAKKFPGLLSTSGLPARSPSPSLEEPISGNVHSHPITAAPPRIPFHQRLNDPSSFTGSQRAKYAEAAKLAEAGLTTKKAAAPPSMVYTGKSVEIPRERADSNSHLSSSTGRTGSARGSHDHTMHHENSSSFAVSESSVIGDGTLFTVDPLGDDLSGSSENKENVTSSSNRGEDVVSGSFTDVNKSTSRPMKSSRGGSGQEIDPTITEVSTPIETLEPVQ